MVGGAAPAKTLPAGSSGENVVRGSSRCPFDPGHMLDAAGWAAGHAKLGCNVAFQVGDTVGPGLCSGDRHPPIARFCAPATDEVLPSLVAAVNHYLAGMAYEQGTQMWRRTLDVESRWLRVPRVEVLRPF